MLTESDQQVPEQTGGKHATHALIPCGAGSIAQAVTEHFKAERRHAALGRFSSVISVEATTAASLYESLKAGKSVVVETGHTICAGMNCGTLSTTAWPVLQKGVDGAVVITDTEAHHAVEELKAQGIPAGPCGASTLPALRRVCKEAREELGLDGDSVVVLYCTEGQRKYEVPA
jgi:diaminopropionate ammonia-lyase